MRIDRHQYILRRPLLIKLVIGLMILAFGAACEPEVLPQTPDANSGKYFPPEITDTAPKNLSLSYLQEAFVEAAEAATKAVVSIESTRLVKAEATESDFTGWSHSATSDTPIPQQNRELDIGSGLIYRPDGVIVTSDHVVRDAQRIVVTLHDGRKLDAQIVGRDPLTDLALIKIEVNGLPTLEFAGEDNLRIGQWAISVGAPYGLQGSVSAGIVSALARQDMGLQRYEQFIQTDAAINVGNSGGPLINLAGRVIGINTAVVADSEGVAFAIPASIVQQVADRLLVDGRVIRGYLGVHIQDMDANLRRYYNVPDGEDGLLVNKVLENSPAQKAGILISDVLLKLNAVDLQSAAQLQLITADLTPGTTHKLIVWREGRQLEFPVQIEELPSAPRLAEIPEEIPVDRIGVRVAQIRLQRGDARPESAVAVSSVGIGSAADKGGLAVGDLIVSVEGRSVTRPLQYQQMVDSLPPGALALFEIEREGLRLRKAVEAP